MKPKHCVIIKYKSPSHITKISDWCTNNIGDQNIKWLSYWSGPTVEYGTEHKFWFVEHKDAMFFSLRWL